MAGKKWELAAAVARHLVKVEPENAAWWINLACATRRCESVEKSNLDSGASLGHHFDVAGPARLLGGRL